jgi:2-oxoglutarate dehydrogenase E2 component (dihydrolipoamide succinyltransferase)
MSQFEIIMPKLGESITEATIVKWFKKENDVIEEDDVLLEIATDKVDSEIPSPVAGKITKILFKEGDLVPVGQLIAVISLSSNGEATPEAEEQPQKEELKAEVTESKPTESAIASAKPTESAITSKEGRFYSPLVKTIAQQEHITEQELDNIQGTGQNGRVRKEDVLEYLQQRSKGQSKKAESTPTPEKREQQAQTASPESKPKPSVSVGAEDQIVEMDRMRRMIADHMVMSKHTAPHVTNVVEADVTNLVTWRTKVKEEFQKREKINLTYMPIFLEAIAKALKEYPQVNASVDGYNIILRKNVNLGVAVALPTGNLIVPVIKNADTLNILGLSKELNRLAEAARSNKLSPDDIQGGTFTISNFGSFRNSFGTPIINQPQVAILATGSIEKKPAVIETPAGDVIAVRHKMFLSLTYDHRVVDGALGGAFLRKIADYLEGFDSNRVF